MDALVEVEGVASPITLAMMLDQRRSTLIGSTFSFALHGIVCCQTVSYFKQFQKDPNFLKRTIALVTLVETINFILIAHQSWFYLIKNGHGRVPETAYTCSQLSFLSILVTTEACCFIVECFFIARLWILLDRRKILIILMIPFLIGWTFSITYIVAMCKHRCYPELVTKTTTWLLCSYAFRIMVDGFIAVTMCSLLYARSSDISRTSSTLAIIRALITWTISTGLLMWASSIVYMTTFIVKQESAISLGTYYVRAGVYTNAILTMLNQRATMRLIQRDETSFSLHLATTDARSIHFRPRTDLTFEIDGLPFDRTDDDVPHTSRPLNEGNQSPNDAIDFKAGSSQLRASTSSTSNEPMSKGIYHGDLIQQATRDWHEPVASPTTLTSLKQKAKRRGSVASSIPL